MCKQGQCLGLRWRPGGLHGSLDPQSSKVRLLEQSDNRLLWTVCVCMFGVLTSEGVTNK